jgi:hypothetical protein
VAVDSSLNDCGLRRSDRDQVAASPWSWRPPFTAWFQELEKLIAAWVPSQRLRFDVLAYKASLEAASRAQASWLYHPCIRALTSNSPRTTQIDFQLAAWAAAHSSDELPDITIPEPLWLWARDGGALLQSGSYPAYALTARVAEAVCPSPVALDVWCDSLGGAYDGSWAAAAAAVPAEVDGLEAATVRFLRTVNLAEVSIPECVDWMRTVCSVVIPLKRHSARGFRSGSNRSLPGAIAVDIEIDPAFIFEGLIHESAHHYFRLAELESPLVNPAHQQRYVSPLRPEPRPLRGIFLAHHALAYIRSFYREACEAHLLAHDVYRQDIDDLTAKLNAAEVTLTSSRCHLTPRGLEFLERTLSVAAKGRAR